MTIASAYRAGWKASAKIDGPSLETAEARYARTHTELEQDAFAAGWIDYASDYAYGTGLRPENTTTTPSADTRAYLTSLPHTPYVSVRATVTRGR